MTNREKGIVAGKDIRRGRDVSAIAFVAMAESDMLDEITIAENAELFPVWDENFTGRAGTIVMDNGKLYKCIHEISRGQNTKPSDTPSQWSPVADPAEEWPEWSQPLGGHDAYLAGAKVTHNKKKWVNTHGDGNIWEPGVYGWTEQK